MIIAAAIIAFWIVTTACFVMVGYSAGWLAGNQFDRKFQSEYKARRAEWEDDC